jgi:CRISPR/Cas system-associated endonuclease Cas1
LGFLYSEQLGKPSLACDFQELYRHLIDDFIIQYCKGLVKMDFRFKTEKVSVKKVGKREYLNDLETKNFATPASTQTFLTRARFMFTYVCRV